MTNTYLIDWLIGATDVMIKKFWFTENYHFQTNVDIKYDIWTVDVSTIYSM